MVWIEPDRRVVIRQRLGVFLEESLSGAAVEIKVDVVGAALDGLVEIGNAPVGPCVITRMNPRLFPSAWVIRCQPDRLAVVSAGAGEFAFAAQRVAAP